jgi:hypothetical protein
MKDFEFKKDQFREAFRHMNQNTFGFERMRRSSHSDLTFEVKLFTNKDQMVAYVNNLTGIENVEIFKIEDDLYKVLVSRKKVSSET